MPEEEEEEEVVLCGTGTVECKCKFFLYSLLMGSVDMQETKILIEALVSLLASHRCVQ